MRKGSLMTTEITGEGSVSQWLNALNTDDPLVADELGKAASKTLAVYLKITCDFATRNLRAMRPDLASQAEDVAHDAFMHAIEQIKRGQLKLKNRKQLQRWLHVATRNIAIKRVRDSREKTLRIRTFDDQDAERGDDVSPVDRVPDHREGEPDAVLVAQDLLERLYLRLGSAKGDTALLRKVLLVRLATQQIVENLLMELATHWVTRCSERPCSRNWPNSKRS